MVKSWLIFGGIGLLGVGMTIGGLHLANCYLFVAGLATPILGTWYTWKKQIPLPF